MKTDPIFYRLFQSFPGIFFELIDCPTETANAYQFSSVEIKQLAFRIDGVFLPTTEASEQPIYFVEVQFQPDRNFYSRLFAEIFLYLDQTELKNDWRAVVIYPSRNVDRGETRRYRSLLASSQVSRIYLDELESTSEQSLGLETLKLVIATEETTPEKARALISQAREEIPNPEQARNLIQLIETIVLYKFPRLSWEEIGAMLGLGDIKQTRAYQQAFEEGREEGLEEGRKEENVAFILRLLYRRVGQLSPEVEAQIRQLSRSQLEALGEALLDFQRTRDLEDWLHSL